MRTRLSLPKPELIVSLQLSAARSPPAPPPPRPISGCEPSSPGAARRPPPPGAAAVRDTRADLRAENAAQEARARPQPPAPTPPPALAVPPLLTSRPGSRGSGCGPAWCPPRSWAPRRPAAGPAWWGAADRSAALGSVRLRSARRGGVASAPARGRRPSPDVTQRRALRLFAASVPLSSAAMATYVSELEAAKKSLSEALGENVKQ